MENGVILMYQTAVSQPKYVESSDCVERSLEIGFSLGLLLEACTQYQSSTKHPDPVNVTAHYLEIVQVAAFQVRVRTLKTGRGFSNVLAEFLQEVSSDCAFAFV